MQTALMASQSNNRLQAAMHRLLDGLRDCVRAYPRDRLGRLPEHDVVWVTDLKGGPELAILDAIKMSPEMWTGAIPVECCIMPREQMRRLLGVDVAEALEAHGAAMVDAHAHRLGYEAEQRERQAERMRRPTSSP